MFVLHLPASRRDRSPTEEPEAASKIHLAGIYPSLTGNSPHNIQLANLDTQVRGSPLHLGVRPTLRWSKVSWRTLQQET